MMKYLDILQHQYGNFYLPPVVKTIYILIDSLVLQTLPYSDHFVENAPAPRAI
jgi:hypothetical protein